MIAGIDVSVMGETHMQAGVRLAAAERFQSEHVPSDAGDGVDRRNIAAAVPE